VTHGAPPFALLSVVIPTLNEAQAIGPTLDALGRLAGPLEVIVVDGGSDDDTAAIALARGARVLRAAAGRGAQLRAGAAAARGDVLWFVHADTRPPVDAVRHLARALANSAVVGGNFAVRFDSTEWPARFLNRFYPCVRCFRIVYGDSAVFVRRDAYERAGGFRPFPLFEDLELVGRLRRRGRWASLRAEVLTSARRFQGRSFTATFLRWLALQVLYWLGAPPRRLGAFYAPIRGLDIGARHPRRAAAVGAAAGSKRDGPSAGGNI
jgi:rSAM/selenodomain-associated transferase 2